MRYFLDTEFNDNGKTIQLISIGLVSEDGREYYAEASFDWESSIGNIIWLKNNVKPYLTGNTKISSTIANDIVNFIGSDRPEFWAYYASYDWVVLCQLYGTMMDLPKRWPKYCNDIQQEIKRLGISYLDLPKMKGNLHNALDDAKDVKSIYNYIKDKY